uniref:Uncharacterized protein n=1 Tax=Arundo donax TaxID=35708 RepID=A0A0A8YND2_ARUDO
MKNQSSCNGGSLILLNRSQYPPPSYIFISC